MGLPSMHVAKCVPNPNAGAYRRVCRYCIGLLGIVVALAPRAPCVLRAADILEIDARVLSAQKQRIAAMRQASNATISIFGLDGGGGGSGVIVTSDGFALTNYHVSSACGDHMRCGLNDGSMVDAVIVGIDATGDVSLIKLLGRDSFPTAQLADSDQVRVGQWCFAAGNPFVLASNLQPSISMGIVSGVHRYQYPAGTLLEYADCIQTDAAINPGNSGGPLFNMAGEIIGINGRCSFEKRGRVNVGVGYAISANQLKYFMGVLRSGRLVDHATLGATVSTDTSGKIVVSNILSSSDAYRRGLRDGDEVLSLADREVRTTNMFKNILGTLPRDWRVPLEFRRNGETRTILVRLSGVHTEKQLSDLVSPERDKAKLPAPGIPSPQEQRSQQRSQQGDEQQSEGEDDDAERPAGDRNVPTEEEDTDAGTPSRASGLLPDVELVSSLLESREGFANYYFNQLYREQLWKRTLQHGDYASSSSSWTLRGNLAGERTKVRIEIDEARGSLQIGARTRTVDFTTPRSDVVAKGQDTGLLVALRSLQDLLQLGPEKLGDTTYMGSAPVFLGTSLILAEQPQLDVIQSVWFDTKVRYSLSASGEVALIEVFGDAGNDPIELYLDQYAPLDSQNSSLMFPSRVRLQYGMEPMLLLELESAQFATSVSSGKSSETGIAPSEGAEPQKPDAIDAKSGDRGGNR